jgi:rubrerythrin
MTYLDGIFEQRIGGDRFPRLVSLYEKAKRDFWNESTEIDWDRDIELDANKKRALAEVLSITYYGERAALALAGQLVATVEDDEARQALACQVIEEAKHVAAFQRLLQKLDRIYPPSFFARRMLTDMLKTDGVVLKMVGMHLFVENLALHTFKTIEDHVEDPLVRQVVDYVARDERKHVALGVIYVPPLLEKMSRVDSLRLQGKQLKWLTLGIGMVKDGYQAARVLDMDLAAAGQHALKQHYEVREKLASHRGLIDVPGMDKLIDALGKWATPSTRGG